MMLGGCGCSCGSLQVDSLPPRALIRPPIDPHDVARRRIFDEACQVTDIPR